MSPRTGGDAMRPAAAGPLTLGLRVDAVAAVTCHTPPSAEGAEGPGAEARYDETVGTTVLPPIRAVTEGITDFRSP